MHFFKDAFKKCAEYGAYLWGVYPVYNAFFMSKKITHDLRFVVGPLWGKINRHDKDLVLHRDEKEDVERTLRHYDKDKSVIRFNDIAIKTKFYHDARRVPGRKQRPKERGLEECEVPREDLSAIRYTMVGQKVTAPGGQIER